MLRVEGWEKAANAQFEIYKNALKDFHNQAGAAKSAAKAAGLDDGLVAQLLKTHNAQSQTIGTLHRIYTDIQQGKPLKDPKDEKIHSEYEALKAQLIPRVQALLGETGKNKVFFGQVLDSAATFGFSRHALNRSEDALEAAQSYLNIQQRLLPSVWRLIQKDSGSKATPLSLQDFRVSNMLHDFSAAIYLAGDAGDQERVAAQYVALFDALALMAPQAEQVLAADLVGDNGKLDLARPEHLVKLIDYYTSTRDNALAAQEAVLKPLAPSRRSRRPSQIPVRRKSLSPNS